jgi:hypothetical protein
MFCYTKKNLYFINLLKKLLLLSCSVYSFSKDICVQHHSQESEWMVEYLPISMKSSPMKIGLVGLFYHLIYKPFYVGIGTYGAIRGDKGGFFSLNLNGGVRIPIIQRLFYDMGLSIGGGGCRSKDGGGGFMITPHAGFGFDFKNFKVMTSYSYVNFPGGDSRSSQYSIRLSRSTTFETICSDHLSQNPLQLQGSHVYVMPLYQVYMKKKYALLNNKLSTKYAYLLGFEGGYFINARFFTLIRTTAIGIGDANGYMSVMPGLGYQYPLSNKLSAVATVLIGGAGGGDVDTGGGFMIEGDVGLSYEFTKNNSIRALIGYLKALGGAFKTPVATMGYHRRITFGGSEHPHFDHVQLFSLTIQNKTFMAPQRTDQRNGSIQLLDIHLDQQFYQKLYLTYQGAFAYRGEFTAGLATGMIGIGIRQNIHKKASIFAQGLLGVAGGGGLDVKGGLLHQYEAGALYHISPHTSLSASIGRVMSFKGKLNATTLGLGFVYHFKKGILHD